MEKAELKTLSRQTDRVELNNAERAKASGSFIVLPSGITHYQLAGDGALVVLTHGYATPYYIYDKVFDRLVSSGYRVLRYDLLGRGMSERTDDDYTPALFARQLDELTRALFGEEAFYLFGTSMGGTVTTAFCRLYPGRVKKLVLFAPAGMDTFKPPLYMRLCKPPVFGDLAFYLVGGRTMLKKCASELKYSSAETKDYYMRSFAAGTKYEGFLKCTLSSMRHTILNTSEAMKGYRSVAEAKLPLLCVWGTDDRTMPYEQHVRLLEICPQTELHTFEGSGHLFLFDEGDRTMDIVLPFLKK